jgi:hypothetical protein
MWYQTMMVPLFLGFPLFSVDSLSASDILFFFINSVIQAKLVYFAKYMK